MKWSKFILIFFLTVGSSMACFSQEKELSWEELQKQYKFPEWYTEARFGIWVHWGAQTEPLQGGG